MTCSLIKKRVLKQTQQLLEVARIIAEKNANVVKLDHNQFKSIDRLHRVHLEVTIETNGLITSGR